MKRCKSWTFSQRPKPLNSEGSWLCHTYWEIGPWYFQSHPEDRPILSPFTTPTQPSPPTPNPRKKTHGYRGPIQSQVPWYWKVCSGLNNICRKECGFRWNNDHSNEKKFTEMQKILHLFTIPYFFLWIWS